MGFILKSTGVTYGLLADKRWALSDANNYSVGWRVYVMYVYPADVVCPFRTIATQSVLWPLWLEPTSSLQWSHNERGGVSNHRRLVRSPSRLLRRRSKKTSKLRVTGHCEGNPPATGGFPSQRVSNVENVYIWWCHHVQKKAPAPRNLQSAY